ncbi:PAS domain-containing protein [Patescibacteria group bacterium]|nr:PAS domain-containing protein [Patescibacteria group bacterium]
MGFNSLQELKEHITSSEELLLLYNKDGEILEVSDPMLSEMSYNREELIGTSATEIHPSFYKNICPEKIRQAIEEGVTNCDCPYVCKDGKTYLITESALKLVKVEDETYVLVSIEILDVKIR